MTWTSADDARVREWLHASAPGGAPGTILDATFERTRAAAAPGRRVGRRRTTWLLLAAALAALLVVGVGGGLAILSRLPAPTPKPTVEGPRFLGDFLWDDGYRFDAAIAPESAITADQAVAIASQPELAPFLGAPLHPIFGRLVCESPGLCGQADQWMGPPDVAAPATWSVWVVEYAQAEAYAIVGAMDGVLRTRFDGEDLSSCSAAEIGTEPGCTAEMFEADPEPPSAMRYALGMWGQQFVLESTYSTESGRSPSESVGTVDPVAVAAAAGLASEPFTAFIGTLECRRAACPDGVSGHPEAPRRVWMVAADGGTRWVIADATSGEVLRTDASPVEP